MLKKKYALETRECFFVFWEVPNFKKLTHEMPRRISRQLLDDFVGENTSTLF